MAWELNDRLRTSFWSKGRTISMSFDISATAFKRCPSFVRWTKLDFPNFFRQSVRRSRFLGEKPSALSWMLTAICSPVGTK